MKQVSKSFVFFVVLAALAACSSDSDSPTKRRTASTTAAGDDAATDTTGTTTPGTSGVLIVELSSAAATGTVGQLLTLTALAYLDAAKTKPVTAATMISFSRVGNGTLNPGQSNANASGSATTQLGATAPGAVTVTASIGATLSAPVTVTFFAPNTGGGGGGGTTPRVVGGVSLTATKTSVLVNDDSVTNDSDSAFLYATVVDTFGAVFAGKVVTLSAADGSLSAVTAITDTQGQVGPIKFTAGIVAQDVDITATVDSKVASTLITVGPGAPLVISVGEPTPAQIGVRGSGAQESSSIVFEIADKYGNPVSDNTVVAFSLTPMLAGVTVSPVNTTTHGGVVAPVVNAGTKSGTIRLIATVPSVGRSVTSGKITIFGGPPSADRFDLAATKHVMSGFEVNGLVSDLMVTVTDRYGNPAVPGTAVYVACEAGRCGANDSVGIGTDALGHAVFTFETAFADLIWNSGASSVYDFGGNVGVNHDYTLLGDPRDGMVKVVAMATGETGFRDLNANGIYDAGDTITTQMPEPFLDINDDGIFNVSTPVPEDYWDFNGSQTWTDILGTYQSQQYVWDSNTFIFNTGPTVYLAPQQYIDMGGDGIFNNNVDLMVVGGPAPVSQPALLTRLPWLPATATINVGYAQLITGMTEVSVSFNDRNDNPLPMDSVMSSFVVGSEATVGQPPAAFLTYGAEYMVPLPARDFQVKDADTKKVNDSWISFCATVQLGDTGTNYTSCIDAFVF